MLIKLSEIKETQAQRTHGEIESLKQSIKEVGLINPITINKAKKLLAGRRRFQAVKELGWKEVDCRILPSEDALSDFKIAIEENLKRKPLEDSEVRSAIAQYDELKRKIEGSAPHGGDRKSKNQVSNIDAWSTDKTAKDLGISSGSVRQAIQAEEAVKKDPSLAPLKTKDILRQEKIKKHKAQPLPTKKFRVIYADPPWKYDVDLSSGSTRSPENNYGSMDLAALKEFGEKVKEFSYKDCILFMWITAPKLNWMNDVLEAWGFEYKTNLIWDKIKPNMGHYSSVRHEILIVAGKGTCAPICDGKTIQSIDSVQSIEKSNKHSEKPVEFRKIIEKLYPDYKKIELFARGVAPDGWTFWGDQVDAD